MVRLFLTVIPLVFCTVVNSEPCRFEQPKCPDVVGTEYELTLLPVITDCSKYIMCQRGTPIVRPCPGNLIFNARIKVCDFPHRTRCIQCDVDEKPEISTTILTTVSTTDASTSTTPGAYSTTADAYSTTADAYSTTAEPYSTTFETDSTTAEPDFTTEETLSTIAEPLSTTPGPSTTSAATQTDTETTNSEPTYPTYYHTTV